MRKLADILATAPVLKKCNIKFPNYEGKIYVKVEYATEESMGAIVIMDHRTKEERYRRETDKQETYQKVDLI